MTQQIKMSSSSPTLVSTHKQSLQKSFKLLKSHACLVANFTLQWQDLEDHLRYIHNQIESKLNSQSHQSTKPIGTEPQKYQNPENFKNQQLDLPQKTNPENQTEKITVMKNGIELISYVKERLKDEKVLRGNLVDLFNGVDEPGKLILEALGEYIKGNVSSEVGVLKRSCVLLLEEFGKLREKDEPKFREEAMRMAVEWKGKIRVVMANCLEIRGFLLLLIAFGLVGEFGYDEIVKLFSYILTQKDAPELFRALGFADKASEFIQNLIQENKRLEAIRFIFAFKLVDKFRLVPLLVAHKRHAKKDAKAIRHNGRNSLKAQDEAAKAELAALRGIIRCIETYNLGFEYSPKILKKRVKELRKHTRRKNPEVKSNCSNPLPQQQNNNKRTVARKNRLDNKRQKATSLNNSAHSPPKTHSGQSSRDDLYSDLAPGTVAHSEAIPHAYVCPSSVVSPYSNQIPMTNASIEAAPYGNVGTLSLGDRYSNLTSGTIMPSKAVSYAYLSPTSRGNQYSNIASSTIRPPDAYPYSHMDPMFLGDRQSVRVTEMGEPIGAVSHAHVGTTSNAYSLQPSSRQPTSLDQGDRCSDPSVVTNALAIAAAYTYHGVLSNALLQQSSSHQPLSLLAGAAPPLGLADPSSATRAYASSSYGLNISANGSSEFGSTRVPTSMALSSDTNANASAPYHHTSVYNSRLASSSSSSNVMNDRLGFHDRPMFDSTSLTFYP